MLVLLIDQRQVPVIDKSLHLNLAGNHAMRFEFPSSKSINNALKIFLLVAQDGFIRCLAEDEPVRVERDLTAIFSQGQV